MAEHEMVVQHSDDDMWLSCTCGWEFYIVGAPPTPQQIQTFAVRHIWAEVHGKVL